MSLQAINAGAPAVVPPIMWLTEKDAAEYVGTSLSTFRRWRRGGIGPEYFRIGDILRYSKAALDEFLEKNTVRPQ